MRRIFNSIVLILISMVTLFIIEKITNVKGLAISIISMFWILFKSAFVSDIVIDVILFFVFAFCIFGTIHLSQRQENKIWLIATHIGSAVSLFLMLFIE